MRPTVTSNLRILGALAVLAAAPRPAGAQAVYLTTREALAEFFSTSDRVSYTRVDLDAPARARLTRRLGYDPGRSSQTFYLGTTAGRIDGYAVIDEEKGLSQPITFAVLFDPGGRVKKMEILAYREPRGDEVRSPRYREQFVGKSAGDPLRYGDDISAVSGATISSRSLAVGVRRAAVMLEDLVLGRGGAGARRLSP